ncbi:MAG: flagellin [Candidatus Sumerlaeota bacterium]
MALVVNTNISSLNAQRNLTKVGRQMDTALERLASGLRINKSGDDAAGLAISTRMSSQIRGLNMAMRNTTDARSVIGMADGAVATQTEILQRMRELSVQAASDLNSPASREILQKEVEQQISELTRVAGTTEFNGLALLNGTFTNKNIQVGANASEVMDISLQDFRAGQMGAIAEITSTAQMSMEANAEMTSGKVKINGVDIGPAQSDGVSFGSFSSYSAIAKAEAINAVSSETGVTATAEATELTSGSIGGATVAAGDLLEINGVAILDGDNGDAGVVIASDDSDFTLTSRINAVSNQTGVTAELNTTTDRIELTAADGRNIGVNSSGFTTAEIGWTAADGTSAISSNNQAAGKVKLHSNENFSIALTNASNDDEVLQLDAQTAQVDANKRVNNIDVADFDGATEALRIIDSALSQIADAQAQLGALTNRLNNTVDNLSVSIENLEASRSRIMDADFAMESSSMTRAQILQQSGTAVLAQANLKPQAALSLLG